MSPPVPDEPGVASGLTAPVRIRSRLWLRIIAPLLTIGAGVLAAQSLSDSGGNTFGAVALTVLCGLVTLVAWWGEVAIDPQRLAVRVLQRDGNQLLEIDRVRIVGLNEAPRWRGGATLIVQDATGRTVALGSGYFPLRRVWHVLRPYLESNPEVVIHPSINALVRERP